MVKVIYWRYVQFAGVEGWYYYRYTNDQENSGISFAEFEILLL